MAQAQSKFSEFIRNRKYEILLVSFVLLLFGDLLFPTEFDVTPIFFLLNVLAGMILFHERKGWRIPLLLVFFGMLVCEIMMEFQGMQFYRQVFVGLYIIYFIFLSKEVFFLIIKTKEVTSSMISAATCGYLILGILGGSIFIIIEIAQEGSFNNITEGIQAMGDLIYFSFITITSVGYGDITPATTIAKNAAMLFGLLGHFYGVVVMGIIIGKFIARQTS